jgi:hypothetical protein
MTIPVIDLALFEKGTQEEKSQIARGGGTPIAVFAAGHG